MRTDPRGGYNRRSVAVSFFNTWSCNVAYVLGYLYADGTLIDASNSSRTQYIQFTSVDKALLCQVRTMLGSNHHIYFRKAHKAKILNNIYDCAPCYTLRIGNKRMYSDLMQFGLTPKKSLCITLPDMESKYLPFFLRDFLMEMDAFIVVQIAKAKTN